MCLSFIPGKWLISESVGFCSEAKMVEDRLISSFPAAKSGIMSIGRQLLQSQRKTTFADIGILLVFSCVPAVGGIQLDLAAEQKAA